MLHHLLGLDEVPAHVRGVPGDLRSLLVAPPQRSERDRPQFHGAPHIENLLHRDLVGVDDMIEKEGECAGIDGRDPGAATVPDVDQPESRHGAERFPHHRPGHAKLQGKRILTRERIPRLETVRPNVRLEGAHDTLDESPEAATLSS